MSGPSCMRDRNLGDGGFLDVEAGGCDLLAKSRYLADLLEILDRPEFIPIDSETRRVISAIFLAGETSTKDF